MPRDDPSPTLPIAADPAIHEDVLAVAAQRRAGLAAIALWEKQHGRLTAAEMEEARRSVRTQLRTSKKVRRTA
jgi:hypothetical protein